MTQPLRIEWSSPIYLVGSDAGPTDVSAINQLADAGESVGVQLDLSNIAVERALKIVSCISRNISVLIIPPVTAGDIYELSKEFTSIRGIVLGAGENLVDFDCFKNLRHYRGPWPGRVPDIFRNLESLVTRNVKNTTENADRIAEMTGLQHLSITGARFGNMDMLENLTCLKLLLLLNMPLLTDIGGLKYLARLEELEMSNCIRCTVSSELIVRLKNIRKLIFTKVGQIDSVEFCRTLRRLELFTFLDSDIVNGDLEPILASASLRHVDGRRSSKFEPSLDSVRREIVRRR